MHFIQTTYLKAVPTGMPSCPGTTHLLPTFFFLGPLPLIPVVTTKVLDSSHPTGFHHRESEKIF